MVYQVIAHAVGDAEKAGITLRVQLEIDHDAKHSSRAELRTALRKYLENAINFSDGGEVVVRVSSVESRGKPTQLQFCVTDQGIGIGAEDQKRVFDVYFRADSALKDGRGGVGMGLAVVKLLVQSMGGEVGVESAPGEGSQFWFTVPLY
jgi:signal transduction histidine kinase